MKILLLGYGKMGKLIDELATQKGHNIVARINSENRDTLETLDLNDIDVAIEFSNPESVRENIEWCLKYGIPVVVGTTGWQEFKSEIDMLCSSSKGTYLYASNFSIGVNLFFKLNRLLAKMMDTHSAYEPQIREIHHTQKLDSPSGTAVTLADGIISEIDRVSHWTDVSSKTEGALPITSERKDPTPGTHIVTYSSEIDNIEIKHTAHSRQGFATGALAVAEWIKDKEGILTMDDYLDL